MWSQSFTMLLLSALTVVGCSTDNTSSSNPANGGSQQTVQIPPTPTGVSVDSITATTIRIAWRRVALADSYYVFFDSSPTGVFDLLSHKTADTMVTHANLHSSTAYHYKVRSVNSAGASELSSVASGITTAAPPPPVPDTTPVTPSGLKTGNSTTSSVDISWNLVPGADSYQLYFSFFADFSSPQLIHNSSAPVFSHTGLLYAKTYYYAVKATNSFGGSSLSAPVPGTTLAVAPSIWVGNAAPNRLVAEWTRIDRVKLYQLNRSQNANFTASSSFDIVDNVMFIDDSLLSKTTYYYRIRAVNSAGVSIWSNVASGTTP